VEIHRSWRSEINRFNSMEQKEWDRIVRNRSILKRATGHDGRELYTDELLFTYLEQFEKDIASVACQVINATEGGARIRGTNSMTLADATNRYCGSAIDPERFTYRDTIRHHDPARLEATAAQLARRITEIDGVVTLCDELLTLLEELKGLTGDPDRFNKRLIRVDELRTKVHLEARAYQIVNAATQITEFRRFSADRKIQAAHASGSDEIGRAEGQIARDIDFISGVRDGAHEVKPMLVDALDRAKNPPWKSTEEDRSA
jgi:hypothetical protein